MRFSALVRPATLGLWLAVSVGMRAAAQVASLPPIHDLNAPLARAADSIGGGPLFGMLIALSDGRVVINDSKRKQVRILDASMADSTVIADTTAATNRTYGGGRGGGVALLRYVGDKILIADPGSQHFHLMSPQGGFVRDIAFPVATSGLPGRGAGRGGTVPQFGAGARTDAHGRLAYWITGGGPCVDSVVPLPNTVFRANLVTGTVDSVGTAWHDACPRIRGGTVVFAIVQHRDEWALLSDGTVAIIRDPSTTIDWIAPDGTRHSSPSVASPHLLSADGKRALADSMNASWRDHPNVGRGGVGTAVPLVIDPGSTADTASAFTGPVLVDAADRLWVELEASPIPFVRPMTTAPMGTPMTPENTPRRPIIYAVINRQGVIVDRVRVPAGATVAGFGPGVMYLAKRDGDNVQLLRVAIR